MCGSVEVRCESNHGGCLTAAMETSSPVEILYAYVACKAIRGSAASLVCVILTRWETNLEDTRSSVPSRKKKKKILK
jgi:hypothetical protein